SEPYDKNNAILELHPGAGGTESQDWASILLRMYQRWAEHKHYKIETLNYLAGDEAGVKSVTLLIKGHNAYGYLKAEKGVQDRKSTRLNSSHVSISYAVFCLKKKNR